VYLVLPFALAALAACGQVTGLSDDFEFDLVDGGTATVDGGGADGTADAPRSDGSTTDGSAGDAADASNKCSASDTTAATQRLAEYNGTVVCKACLAPACCTDIDVCFHDENCSRVLGCKLDCTTRSGGERSQCFKNCNTSGGGVPPLYTNGIGACSTSACNAKCAFQ
jgi:hypothetical protein